MAILHELQRPVTVVVYGLFDNSHRHVETLQLNAFNDSLKQLLIDNILNNTECVCSSSGLQESARVLFQNADCLRRFGPPRTMEEYHQAVRDLSYEDQVFRRNWMLQIAQVSVCLIPMQHWC